MVSSMFVLWTYPDDFVYIDVTAYLRRKKKVRALRKSQFFHIVAAVLTFKKPQAFYPLKLSFERHRTFKEIQYF